MLACCIYITFTTQNLINMSNNFLLMLKFPTSFQKIDLFSTQNSHKNYIMKRATSTSISHKKSCSVSDIYHR